jgi:hypothetical protein
MIVLGVLCVSLGNLLRCVCRVVTLRLSVSAIATIITVIPAAAVALAAVFAVLTIVALPVARPVTRPPTILLTFAALVSLTLF